MALSLFSRVRVYLFATLALLLFAAIAAQSVAAATAITGTVYRDFNGNGTMDAGDVGLGGIGVAIFDSTNTQVASATSAADGTYSADTTGASAPLRVEFTIPASPDPLSFYKPAAKGTSNDTSVQFVNNANVSGLNFGVNYPGDFCQNNPNLCSTSYVNGNLTSAAALSELYQWPYNSTGTSPAPTSIATASEIGSTWGLALARTSKTLYISAVVKRHVDIGPGGGGTPNPYGTIYKRDLVTGTNSYFATIPVAATGSVTRNTTCPNDANALCATTTASHDSDAYAKVGKTGLGGITISDDESTLYVTSLGDGKIYSIPVSTGTPALFGGPTVSCTNGVYRPWALKFWRGKLYAGGVCDASTGTKADLKAVINAYDFTTNTWSSNLLTNPSLDMSSANGGSNKGEIVNCTVAHDYGYYPWSDAGSNATLATAGTYYCRDSSATNNPHIEVHPMPILSDLEFDVDGSMMIGLTDRFGNMIGWRNWGIGTDTQLYDVIVGGDTLRACPNNSSSWDLESNGSCGGVTTGGANNHQGLHDGEWYFGDTTKPDGSQTEDNEGGLTFVPGKGQIVSTAQDPNQVTIAQGVIFENNGGVSPGENRFGPVSGNPNPAGYQLYVNASANSFDSHFGKANGLGDLIALCSIAPVEIGNRVWNDTNGDGIQDAGENPIAGVDVQLWVDTDNNGSVDTKIATARTDASGNYYFSNDPRGYPTSGNSAPNAVTGATAGGFVDDSQGGRTSTADAKYGLLGLKPGQNFEVRLDTSSAQNDPLLTGLSLTTPNAGSKDTIDSDASMVGSVATIAATTGGAGENDHTFDIGFTTPTSGTEDYGDLPDTSSGTGPGNYQTLASDGGPHHTITAGLNIGAPDVVDGETGTLQNSTATADDASNTGYADDEDGIAGFPTFMAGQTANVDVTVNNVLGSPATLYGFIDWNGDGDFGDTGEATSVAVPDGTVGTVTLNFNVPANALPGTDLGARFRLTTDTLNLDNSGAIGGASNGEVEDYIVTIPADYGDLPDTGSGTGPGNYQTLASDGGPYHIITTGLNIGAPDVVDAETGTLQNSTATADDASNTGYADDEDGIASFPTFTPGQTANVDVTVNNVLGSPATLYGFIDWNGDGDFGDTGEATSVAVPDGTVGTVTLNFNVPAGAVTGTNLGARFRLTTDTLNLDNSGAIGGASNGEVEDYIVTASVAPPALGTIGNRVWLDEDSNGYQDKGEDGIPNVTVQLKDSGGSVIATQVTDANGGYLFTGLPAGTYSVQVLGSTIPTGMTQTTKYPNPGGDFYNQNQSVGAGYQIVLGAGDNNLTADFGYNWNSTHDVTTGGSANTVAALGDRLWIDINGNGRQDEGEVGVQGAVVELFGAPGPDGIWGNGDDVPYTAGGYNPGRTTDANGNYMFDNLPPGQYETRVVDTNTANYDVNGGKYTQTGDPDHFGTTGPVNDNETTIPVLLGPGDVFLNADYGYQPGGINGTPQLGSIGNFVWYDRDADGVGPTVGGEPHGDTPGTDNTEFGIAGVTVSLIRDLNANGQWDAGEPIIATTHTSDGTEDVDHDGNVDYRGYYNFRGLTVDDGTGTDDYLVRVNDTNNVLNGLRPTYDSDGPIFPSGGLATGLGISSVADLTTTAVIDQDFGYTNLDVLASPTFNGVLGDRVWLDTHNPGVQDADEPGIPGVTVNLYDSTGTTLIATTTTGADGLYLFPNLPTSPGGVTYVVKIDTSTLPGGLTQTFDYDGTGSANQSTRTLTDAAPIQLDQDFGYVGSGTIGNLVWLDTNADGVVNGSDSAQGIGGVTIDLYYDKNGNGKVDAGETKLASTTTAPDGSYLFTGLPTNDGGGNAQYVVNVTDTAGVLQGMWHSVGDQSQSSNNNSKYSPYAATLTPGAPNMLTADFGYYLIPGAVGNYVWYDTDADGVQDGTEVGVNGATVTLTIRYPGADNALNTGDDTITTLTTTTMTEPDGTRNGWYSFGNLLQDENYNGAGTYYTEPKHTLTVTLPTGYAASPTGNGTPTTDSNNAAGTTALPLKGDTDTSFANDGDTISSYDFGIYRLRINGTVWLDINNGGYNGVLDNASETPSGGAESGLTVYLYADSDNNNVPDGAPLQTRTTGLTGNYIFEGLAPGRYIVSVVQPSGWRSTIDNYDAADTANPNVGTDNNDNGIGGVTGQVFSHSFNLVAGDTNSGNAVVNATATTRNDRLDFGMNQSPTAVELADVTAQSPDTSSVVVSWQTLNERLVTGFNIQRSDTQNGTFTNVNSDLINAKTPGSDLGNAYDFTDTGVTDGATYWYRVEVNHSDRSIQDSDPVQVTVGAPTCTGKTAAATLLTPKDKGQVKAAKVKFQWNAVSCAMTYKFQLRLGSAKGKPVLNKKGLTKTFLTRKKLEAGTVYFWRVLACNASGQCTASDWQTFQTKKEK